MEERQEAKRQKWAGVVEERERRRAAEEEKLAPKRAKRERELDHLDRQMADCRKREAELREERRVLAVKPL
jgi:predicted  nucleic acid-binding Zn-ribbon protein